MTSPVARDHACSTAHQCRASDPYLSTLGQFDLMQMSAWHVCTKNFGNGAIRQTDRYSGQRLSFRFGSTENVEPGHTYMRGLTGAFPPRLARKGREHSPACPRPVTCHHWSLRHLQAQKQGQERRQQVSWIRKTREWKERHSNIVAGKQLSAGFGCERQHGYRQFVILLACQYQQHARLSQPRFHSQGE